MKTKPSLVRHLAVGFIVASLSGFCAVQARANTVAVTLSSTHNTEGAVPDVTAGWDFSVSSNILVTELGILDADSTFEIPSAVGLDEAHTITIWTSSGTFVTSAVVPSGTSATLVDDFRYVSIVPALLTPGSYVIGAYYTHLADTFITNVQGFSTPPELTFGGHTRVSGGNTFPAPVTTDNGWFGPNFQFTDGSIGVAEGGSSWTMLVTALAAVFGLWLILQRRFALDGQMH